MKVDLVERMSLPTANVSAEVKTDSPANPSGVTPVKKESTTDLPMFDLNEALAFVTKIHERALEAASMPDVAKGMEYTNPSSTPFYRRMTAGRLFGLLSKSGAELTARARDYLKPESEDARSHALQEAVMGIAPYAEEIGKHYGKKLNTTFIANSFAKAFGLTDGCARACARAFESSAKMAGFISEDGTVKRPSETGAPAPQSDPKRDDGAPKQPVGSPDESIPGLEKHALTLDPKNPSKRVVIHAPPEVTRVELERIKNWLSFQLLISNPDNTQPGGEK